MTPLGFAWRSLSREPARATLGVAGVAIVGALLFDMLLLSNGLLISFRDLLRSTGFDVRVTATDALPGAGPAIGRPGDALAALSALPEVREVRIVRFGAASLRRGERWVPVAVLGSGPQQAAEGRVVRGRDVRPGASPPEILVNEELARQAGAEPGGDLALRPGRPDDPSALPATVFRVAGVAEFPFDVAGERSAAVSLDAFRGAQLGPDRDEADILLVASAPGATPEQAVASIRAARPDLHAFTIEEFLESFRAGDFSYFRQISAVLSAVTSFFAFLLIATLLTVSVNQRLGEVAALRALGFRRARVAADLLAESALVVGSGSLLALPLGWVIARVLDDILRGMPGLPERLHFFVLDPAAVAVHLGVLAGAGLLAAVYPVAIVVRLPIAGTLRREVIS